MRGKTKLKVIEELHARALVRRRTTPGSPLATSATQFNIDDDLELQAGDRRSARLGPGAAAAGSG